MRIMDQIGIEDFSSKHESRTGNFGVDCIPALNMSVSIA